MSNGITKSTDGGISQRTNVHAERQMLMHAQPHIVLGMLGMKRQMPRNKSTNIRFRRPKTFTAADTPLVEGVTPASTKFQYEDVPATLRQYGQVVEMTDVIEDTHEDPVLKDATLQCGENIGRTMEALDYAEVKAGTNVFYANGTVRTAVNTAVSLNDLRRVVRALQAQKAKMITQILGGGPNYNTVPVEAAYVAVCHTDLEADIRNLTGFHPVADYASRKVIHERELGTVENIRFITSADLTPWEDAGGAHGGNVLTTSGTSADVYPILVFGQDAFGCVALRGQGSVSPSIIPVGQRDKSDPLGQRGYVGWKTWHVAKILNQAWMARIEVGASVLT